MNCPYCQHDMEVGMIQSGRQIFFSKQRKKFVILADKQAGDIVVGPMDWFYSSYSLAHHCQSCNKIIIDIATER